MASDAIIDVTPVEVNDKPPKNRRKMIVLASVAALLLAVVGGGGAWWMLRDKGANTETAHAETGTEADSSSYIEVPPLVVNLRGGDRQARFLKVRFIIVASNPGKVDSIKERLPAVIDALQPFLRELRPDDLDGSAAVFRIKEEMMVRATQALGAGTVRDVLIQDLVQQ